MRILVYPALKEKEGSGHLRRSLMLIKELGDDAQLLYDETDSRRDNFLRSLGFLPGDPRVRRRLEAGDAWDLIALDRRETAREEIATLEKLGCVVGLDEGGALRSTLPFLIDTLPGGLARHPPNVRAIQLPAYPAAKKEKKKLSFREVLVSFGGEDAAHLSERLLELLLSGDFGFQSITVVEGPLFGSRSWPPGVKVLCSPHQLVDLIPDYDLVFCSFGLTCFEALAAKVPVILLNPRAQHHRLSRSMNLPEIGVGSPDAGKLRRLLARPDHLNSCLSLASELVASPEQRLPVLLPSLKPPRHLRCPLCGSERGPALARFPLRTYVRCRKCGLIYLLSFAPGREVYEKEYFFEEYRRQYGRTYLEDFPAIKRRAAGRLKQIGCLLTKGKLGEKRLLDVGGAYGAFQQAAEEAGYRTMGLDMSRESASYVREKLGMQCLQGDFETTTELAAESFDVLTMWFVIEHFRSPAAALKQAARLLRPGGVLAFSTPNGSGISARSNRKAFLQASPGDHYTVWSPSRVGQQLARFGFKVIATRMTGNHPERFPLPACLRAAAGPLLKTAGRVLRLGDTFEVYAVKTKAAGSIHVGG
jgi:2-polyprenyl-3-methyl-5-hydroxy-6-metoxy-1,4-benzoquinol methylase